MILTAAFHVAGVVVDESGAPVASAIVLVMPDRSGGMPANMPIGPPARIRTDEAGAFMVPNLLSGAYVVSAAVPVVTSGGAASGGPVTGAGGSSFGSIGAAGTAGGSGGGFVMSELRNGATTEFRGDPEAGVRITIDSQSIDNMRVVVRRAQ
jgi:hypothetical protein